MATPHKPNPQSIASLIAPALDPVVRKRGLARAELLAFWPDIVGAAYAGRAVPERIRWPRDGKTAATLVVRCDPSLALQLSYEAELIRERLNAYLGFGAVGAVRIVQHPVGHAVPKAPKAAVPADAAERLEERIDAVDGPLRDSLRTLGLAIIARS